MVRVMSLPDLVPLTLTLRSRVASLAVSVLLPWREDGQCADNQACNVYAVQSIGFQGLFVKL